MDSGPLLRSMERLCDLPVGNLEPTTAIKSVEAWDSLRVVELVAMLDTDYGVTVDYDELSACKTVADLIALVEAAQGRLTNATIS